jgi:glycosyltransferase involved in cell wall biosynthesis
VRAALVVQRYGVDVLGGAESLARRVAELLTPEVELTVLTTCALEYRTWADHYPAGEDEVNGVRVLRFPVPEPRVAEAFDRVSTNAYRAPEDVELGRAWMRAQGPNAPGLLEHLREQGTRYDAVAFVTYLYATTVDGLPLVAQRSLLCPTMHDEPPLRLAIFDQVFELARLCLFSTPEERELAQRRFGVRNERARVVGAGIDEHPGADPERFRSETGIDRPYALYLGRLDPSKGVLELVEHHAAYRAANGGGLDLVLIGGGELALPAADGFHALGFVSEGLKHDALAGAAVVVCPSPYESLSFTQLEAWVHGRPTLASAASPVLVGQSRRSGGGLWYSDGDEYAAMLDLLARAEPLASAIGAQGRRYVRTQYRWRDVRDAWLTALDEVASAPGRAARLPA